MSTIKDRLIIAIGLTTVERPRQLQLAADTNEHHVVHALYRLEKDGLTSFKVKRNAHAPGRNLTKIQLTPKGIEKYRELTGGR
jgi:hypothetical protein